MPLTHVPAHTSSHPDRFEDEETGWGYSVLPDIDAEDPRNFTTNEHAVLWAFRQPSLGSSYIADFPEGNFVLDAFRRFWEIFGAEASLEATRRWLTIFHPDAEVNIDIATIRGYSQSDWLDVVAVTQEGYGTPAMLIDEVRTWAFGDVWTVIPDRGAAISGIYADDAEEALARFRENFEDTEPEPDSASVHIWSNSLPEAIAECLTDREEAEADRAVAWLTKHESDDVVWTAINRLFDELQQLAADDQE